MKRLTFAITLLAISVIALRSVASAQEWVGLHNKMIEIAYLAPTVPKNQPTYELLKNRQVLEELSAFLSPLRLPSKLAIAMTECGFPNMSYNFQWGAIILCYEFPAFLSDVASRMTMPAGLTRQDVVVGTFVQAVLHEVGHAIFHMLQIPVFGREEDAADQIAALVMLNFGKDFAQRNLIGSAQLFKAIDSPVSQTDFADVHGTALQRYYNMLCMAYGAQPETFKGLVEAAALPKHRAAYCRREYQHVEFAFASTVWPHIDQDLLKKVQTIEWAKW